MITIFEYGEHAIKLNENLAGALVFGVIMLIVWLANR
jgi:hypothetical protein